MDIKYSNCKEEVFRELDELYTIQQWREKYIVLFGLNSPAEIELDYFLSRGIKVEAFIDNDKGKWEKEYKGCKVCPPDKVLGKYHKNAIIIIASSASLSMQKQIMDMGYSKEQIYNLKSFEVGETNSFPFEEDYEYKELTLREIQLETLKIMIYIKEFCNKKNIRYYLTAGTLLGAVRHNGFIPWDDDVDILMPWTDYVRFCREFPDNDNYELYSMLQDNPYELPCICKLTKILDKNTATEIFNFPIRSRRGICVDVFPMNGYPDNPKDRDEYDKELKRLGVEWGREVNYNINLDTYSRDIHEKKWHILEKAMQRYDYDSSNYVGCVSCTPYNHAIAPKSKYEAPSVVVFEGEEFLAPGDTDYILRETYGNYMKLPPKEEQHPRHFYHTYRIKRK